MKHEFITVLLFIGISGLTVGLCGLEDPFQPKKIL